MSDKSQGSKYSFEKPETVQIIETNDGFVFGKYVSQQTQTLAEAAKEIKDLLAQLQTTYPPKTNEEKQVLVTKFNEEIETNSRVRKILLAGGIELIKMICPPLGIPIEMGKQWLETAKRDLGK